MAKIKLLFLFSLFFLISCHAKVKPFKYEYSQDFSVKVSVPNTASKIMKNPQNIDKEITALELSKKMGNGINLGNTMEAYRGWNNSTKNPPTYYEQLWGQPITTIEIMQAYKEAGFSSVRIPVAWTNMMDYEHQDYAINSAYLDRVEEIVNYALDCDLFVIINDHWDGQWWGMFGSKNKNHQKEAVKIYKSIWLQVANRFKNYDEKLIFESANEELGDRLNDDTVFSNNQKGDLTDLFKYQATNKINQCFVDLVRKTGGNNKYRFLLIAGYNTDFDKVLDSKFQMPADTIENRLFLSVHYYTPSTYCILKEDASWGRVKNSWGTKDDKNLLDNNFAKLQKFTEKGYGVIIGEYGVSTNKDNTKKDGMEEWLTGILDNCDKYNYVPFLWDCNTFFSKKGNLGFIDEEIANVYSCR